MWCYRAIRVRIHVPRSGTLRCIRITVWYLYSNHSSSWIPCRIQLLSRTYRPYLLCFPSAAAAKTWLIIPLGIAAFIVFYVVFRFAIVKFDLKTPGREDDDDDETKVVLANDDFTTVAKIVLEGVGGKDNVESVDNCITRLRLVIKDYTKVDEKKIKSAGVAGVVRPSQKDVQVIIGTKVQFVADEFKKLCK